MSIAKSIEELQQREEKIYAQQMKSEESINAIIGAKLTAVQFFQLRGLFAEFEKCENALINIQERIEDLREKASA